MAVNAFGLCGGGAIAQAHHSALLRICVISHNYEKWQVENPHPFAKRQPTRDTGDADEVPAQHSTARKTQKPAQQWNFCLRRPPPARLMTRVAGVRDNGLFAPITMPPQLHWLEPDDPLPPPSHAWEHDAPAPGLLAAGGALNVATLCAAYAQGTFPWYSHGQPILWWTPDPRMVLPVCEFRVHRSLRKTLRMFRASRHCEIRVDSAFKKVIRTCATKSREGQTGTWIVPEMINAYIDLHEAGHAHSVETWIHGELVGGLYCVTLGRAVFGESMFSHTSDASKIALAALVSLCRLHGVEMIDCQQNTRHLASLGSREIARSAFLEHIEKARQQPPIPWMFEPIYWNELLTPQAPRHDATQ